MAKSWQFWSSAALAFAKALPVASHEASTQVRSVRCEEDSPHGDAASAGPVCSVASGAVPGAQASGTWHDDIEKTGWGRLLVRTACFEPGPCAFAAGYLEGFLTAERVDQQFNNTFRGASLDPLPAGMADFLQSNDAWWQEAVRQAGPRDEYWRTAGFISDQLHGLVAGVNAGLGKGRRQFSRLDLLAMNSFLDLDDIKQAVNASQRAAVEAMAPEALALWVKQHGHCTAVVKLVPDGSELFAGHNTWCEYYNMLRVYRRYEFGSRTPIAMSSYPGMLSSGDDFYQVGRLVIMETTLPNYNNDLFGLIKPEALLFWVRAMVANYLAKTGPDWMETFKKFNSGTYNNMWMVVDYGKFTPGQPLPEGVLTVGEQLPGYFQYRDQTQTLSYGYWPSYNAAVYPETARLIQQDVMAEAQGGKFSYQLVDRAQIFRRDQAKILSDEDMQRTMRYNQFQTDPIANGDSCAQLACRSDLASDPVQRSAFGAIDAKYTSSAHNRRGDAVIVAGPTHDDQPPFDWSALPAELAASPHVGQPSRWAFGWLLVGPDMGARPWGGSPDDSPGGFAIDFGGATAATVAVAAASLVGLASAIGYRRRAADRDGEGVLDIYKKLAASPGDTDHSTECTSSPASSLTLP